MTLQPFSHITHTTIKPCDYSLNDSKIRGLHELDNEPATVSCGSPKPLNPKPLNP